MDGSSPAAADRSRILAYEETALTAWPALEQVLLDGWLVRFARGFTGRANSVNPLYAGALGGPDVADKIARCEALYAERGLACTFRLTPLAGAALDAELAARGYGRVNPSAALVLDLEAVGRRPERAGDRAEGVVIATRPESAWLEAYAASGARPPEMRPVLEAILARIPGRSLYGMIAAADGAGSAVAQGVLDDRRVHLINVATAPAARRRGLAGRVVAEILDRARDLGAREALIHVATGNAAAAALYDGLGAREVYVYHYRRRPDDPGGRAALALVR